MGCGMTFWVTVGLHSSLEYLFLVNVELFFFQVSLFDMVLMEQPNRFQAWEWGQGVGHLFSFEDLI